MIYTINQARLVLWLSVLAIAGCASTYPVPKTAAVAQFQISASGLQRHAMYVNDSLQVHIYVGDDAAGPEAGLLRLTNDEPTASFKLDQGVEYLISMATIESDFGGYTSCGFDLPVAPGAGRLYSIEYVTRKSNCDLTVYATDAKGQKVKVAQASSVAGGMHFRVTIVRY